MSSKTMDFESNSSENVLKSVNNETNVESSELPEEENLLSNHVEK